MQKMPTARTLGKKCVEHQRKTQRRSILKENAKFVGKQCKRVGLQKQLFVKYKAQMFKRTACTRTHTHAPPTHTHPHTCTHTRTHPAISPHRHICSSLCIVRNQYFSYLIIIFIKLTVVFWDTFNILFM